MTADVGDGVVVVLEKGICACPPTAFAGTDDFSAANEIVVFSRALIYRKKIIILSWTSLTLHTLVQELKKTNRENERKLTRPRNFQSTGKPKRK
jgi:hypothetical protein